MATKKDSNIYQTEETKYAISATKFINNEYIPIITFLTVCGKIKNTSPVTLKIGSTEIDIWPSSLKTLGEFLISTEKKINSLKKDLTSPS